MPYDIYDRTQAQTSGGVVPGQVPSGGGEFGPIHVIRAAVAASAQDVTIFPTAGTPLKCRLLDVWCNVSTGNASETLTVRDASGGGGNALSSAISLASTGKVRDAGTASTTLTVLAAGSQIYCRRNTTVAVGDVFAMIQYEL